MVNNERRLEAVFSALADPTRRRIVERLARGELTVGDIATGFTMSQPAISKHVKVLEQSGLLKRRVSGRVHHCRLDPRAMRPASAWIETQQRFWNTAFDNLDDFLQRTSDHEKT